VRLRKTQPSSAQVRAHYLAQGFEVKIDNIASGFVRYRNPGEKLWDIAGWISDHTIAKDGTISLRLKPTAP
jgi:hypothetical protein